MFIAIDIGNTMLKAAFFIEGAAEELLVFPAESHVDEFVAGIERWLSHSDEVEAVLVSFSRRTVQTYSFTSVLSTVQVVVH